MIDYNLDQSELDYLTGRANRRGLYNFYNNITPGTLINAMYIDIDNFKRVNDIYGHNLGDILLTKISNLIFKVSGNFTARIGGDEYVIVFNASVYNAQRLEKLAQKMLMAMPEINFRKDILSIVSLSIGIVLNQDVSQDLEDILKKCDTAMYMAKNGGKNRYCFYEPDDSEQKQIYKIEAEMENALSGGQFVPMFQPRMNIVTMQIIGAEVVASWIHPEDGILSPKFFIPIFEKNGFISKLDIYMIEETCKAKAGWKGTDYEHLPVSVSISRVLLYDETFPIRLSIICDKYEIPHSEIEIQMSEDVFIKDNKEMTRMVDSLIDKDFKVSITDFGSGFSSLSLLQSIPVDTIKMDSDFVQSSVANDKGRHVLRNIISLCKDLKLDIVADGICTTEQSDFIMTCGCSFGQGSLFSHPMYIMDFIRYAEEYLSNPTDSYKFSFNGNLLSEDGSKEATIVGEGLTYTDGIFKNSKALSFPGGPLQKNCVIVPNEVLFSDSYTISMWIRPRRNLMWASALYVKYETGFCSIIPMSPDSHSDFRIRDSREVSGWYDLVALTLREGIWYHYTVTYNARTERAVSFVNGEVSFIMENVPTNRFAKLIIVGGDVFQPSFEGDICEITFYNEAKDYDFVATEHENVINNPDYVGDPDDII
ncbi:MAG: EAL domain-containing protein [Lachnospiraceae bacterium]|nr:EAL domain-containing protein [Lachnospiraceae bacterium]